MVQQRRELCFLVLSCYFAHTVQRTWHALPGSVSGTCFAGPCSPWPGPFPPPPPQPVGPALFGGFAGTMGLSDFPWSFISGVRPRPSRAARPVITPDGRARDLPVLAHGDSVHARFSDRAGSASGSR